jgi:D-alanine transfer protein
MNPFLKKMLIAVLPPILAVCPLFAVGMAFPAAMPEYRDSLGSVNHNEKIKGLYLLKESAKRDDNLIIYGSSELAMLEIPTHPSNFFAGKRSGFQVNVVGRGSCQSLMHALSIAASGDALTGKKVALITSPQSYVPQGIAPDMFMANFSPLQLAELLAADDLAPELKQAISSRVDTLLARYEAETATKPHPGIRLAPYRALSLPLLRLKDMAQSRILIESAQETAIAPLSPDIDWAAEERAAIAQAQTASSNNGFGMLNDYYMTNVGQRLDRLKDRDANSSYAASEEYGDLRLLFEACRQKGIDPLFIHVPMHGQWSDYTGFTAEKRQAYYENVRAIADEYGIETLDLTSYEYEEYFLCDVMHLGWKGWLEVDKALIGYFNSN